MDEWSDPAFVAAWDRSTISGNPSRAEQLEILVDLVAAEGATPIVLDIGCGTGLVDQLILERVPQSTLVGLDGSAVTLGIAERRLAPFSARIKLIQADIRNLKRALIRPDIALSVQTLHNLSHSDNKNAIRWIFTTLKPGGLFILMDRIRVPAASLFNCYQAVWRWQERTYATRVAGSRGDFAEYERRFAEKGDSPATLQQNLTWLEETGFTPGCLHLQGDRALIVARKTP